MFFFSLHSLKFVGRKTSFTCADDITDVTVAKAVVFDNSCHSHHDTNSSLTACSSFLFDESEFRSTVVQRWSLVCDRGK
jgi:hypothetical protein